MTNPSPIPNLKRSKEMKSIRWKLPDNTIFPVYVAGINYEYNDDGTFGHISTGYTIESNNQLEILLSKFNISMADEIKVNDTKLIAYYN